MVRKERAAEALKLTAEDGMKLKIVDDIIQEPLGGAHSDRDGAFKAVQEQIIKAYKELKDIQDKDLIAQRMDKYANMGVYKE